MNRSGTGFGDADMETAAMLRIRLGGALERLARPGHAVPAAGPAAPAAPAARGPLTRRDAGVLDLLAGGLTNDQIAHRPAISPRTVGKHLEHAYPKLRVSGRVEAATVRLAAGGG